MTIQNIQKKGLFFCIIFTIFWLSIGSKPSDIADLNINLKEILNLFLISTPLLLSTLILAPLGLIKITNTIEPKKFYKLHYLFLLFFSLQLVGLAFNNHLNFNLENSYLAILGLGFTFLIITAEQMGNKKIFKYFLYISMLVLLVLASILIITKINTLILTADKYLYNYAIPGEKFLYQEMPRVTGFSRTLGILVLFFLGLIIWKLKSKPLILFLSFTCFVFLFFIYGMQSRGSILCYTAVFLLIIFFAKKLNLKFKIFFLLIFFLFPAITYEGWLFYKTNSPERILSIANKTSIQLIDKNSTPNRIFDSKATATGRTLLWKEVMQNYELKKIFGYGPQADRFLITSDKGSWLGSNSSNAIVYAFASGGYFAALILLIIYLRGAYLLFLLLFVDRIFAHNNKIEIKISFLFFVYFIIRAIFENSFALFSTDFILTILSISIIENYFTKKDLKKLS